MPSSVSVESGGESCDVTYPTSIVQICIVHRYSAESLPSSMQRQFAQNMDISRYKEHGSVDPENEFTL